MLGIDPERISGGYRMRTLSRAALLAAALAVAGLGTSGCSKFNVLKGRMAFKDANTAYAASDYKKAADKYQEALGYDPQLSKAYFYLANSYDNMYKPTRKGEAEPCLPIAFFAVTC
jgi:tetratricopeptide (TPR) repeat protein